MPYRYFYVERSLFRERLLESGTTPGTATTYETAVLNPNRAGHGASAKKWKQLMGCPIPATYEAADRIFERIQVRKSCEDPGKSVSAKGTAKRASKEVLIAESLLALSGSMSELTKVLKKLNDLTLLSHEKRVDYVIEYLTSK